MKSMARFLGLVATIAVAAFAAPAMAAEPVQIVYGYHPYWTGAWYGVILKKMELWKKHLPPGSSVKFEPHLTGPPMINAMLADKMQIGTMGDMPSLVLSTKQKIADVRLVGVAPSIAQRATLPEQVPAAVEFDLHCAQPQLICLE